MRVVIEAGHQHFVFQDDQAYPYRPSPWYQWLAPAPAAPGSLILLKNNELPELLLVTPDDYWHAPPQLPTAPWTRQFHLVALPSAQAALDRALGLRGKVVWLGESPSPRADWAANPARLLARLEQERATKIRLRAALHAGGQPRRGTRPPGRRSTPSGRGAASSTSTWPSSPQPPRTRPSCPIGSIVALNEHCATLHYQLRDRAAPPRCTRC